MKILILPFVIFLLLVNSSFVFAQEGNGKIKGTVTDAYTGEPLFGTNVILLGTSLGAASTIDGEYFITNIPAGTYTIQFTYIGYKTVKVENVKVESNQTLTFNSVLEIESLEGETVVVTAQKKGQISAINQQLSSNNIQDIVAKEFIQEVPDINAAESIGRLPGVSLQRSGGEGNKIIVRGLSPQYNAIEIDGVKLTGVDLNRSVGLSLISNDMLGGIELSKSLTPDRDADALGGTVNLTLREAEEGLHYELFSQGSYNKLREDYGNYKFSGSISSRFFENSLGALVNIGTEKINRASQRFGAGYGAYRPNNQEYGVQATSANISENLDERYRTFANVVLDYKLDFMKLKLANMYSRKEDQNEARTNSFDFGQSRFDFTINREKPVEQFRSHSFSSLFTFWTTELKLDVAYTRSELENYNNQFNFWDRDIMNGKSIPPSQTINAQPSTLITKYYDISSPRTSILYENLMTTTNRLDETYTYRFDWKVPYSLTEDVSGYVKAGGMINRKERSSNSDRFDGAFYGGKGINFVSNLKKNNVVPGLIYNGDVGIPRAEGFPALNWADNNYDWGNILDGRYKLGYSIDLDALIAFTDKIYGYQPGHIIQNGAASYNDDYSNIENKDAAYIMTELKIGQNLMLLPGVRYEKMHTEYSAFFIQEQGEDPDGTKYIKPAKSITDHEYWFPSINIKYNVNSWSDVRAAYFVSASRPDYSLLSPGLTATESRQRITARNPYLKPSIANNFDLIFSIHNNEIGLLSIGGFYKEIDDLIFFLPEYAPGYFDKVTNAPAALIESLQKPRRLYDSTLITERTEAMDNYPINNPEQTYFRGFEINWQTNFWYLPGLLSNLVLDVNYSKIWSKTRIPYLQIVQVPDPSSPLGLPMDVPYYRTREARMVDQPSDIVNVRLGWDYKGFSTRVSLRYQGETLQSSDPVNSLMDRYTKGLFMIDLTMKQEIMENLSLMLDIANLTDYIDDSNIINGTHTFPTNSEYYGFIAQFGVRYTY